MPFEKYLSNKSC